MVELSMTTTIEEAVKELSDYRLPEDEIQWRIGNKSRDKKKATAFAYADQMVYEQKLNEICGYGGWGTRLIPWADNKVICELNILGVTRSSSGQKTNSGSDNDGPTAEAQAMKRACGKFGLLRYFNEFPFKYYAIDDSGYNFIDKPKVPVEFLPKKEARVLNAEEVVRVKDDLRKAGVTTQSALTRAMQEALGRKDWSDWGGITNVECNKLLDHVEGV